MIYWDSTIYRNMRFCLNSLWKIVIRVTSLKRYQNVRPDLTILGPFANVTLTLCVSWGTYFVSHRIKNDIVNPFKPNWISHFYQLDQYISVLRVVRCYISYFFQNFDRTFCKKTVETLIRCGVIWFYTVLPMSHKKDASLLNTCAD